MVKLVKKDTKLPRLVTPSYIVLGSFLGRELTQRTVVVVVGVALVILGVNTLVMVIVVITGGSGGCSCVITLMEV